MSVTLIFKIAAVGILVSVLSQVLKHSGREEQAFLTSLAGLLLVLFWIIPYVYELFVTMETLFTLAERGETMIKIALIGIVGILLALQIKTVKPEYAVYLCMGVSLLIFMGVTEQLQIIVDAIQAIETYLPLDQRYIKILLKIVGITYIAEFSSDLCKDAGYQTIAGQIQIFGKLSVLAVSMPVLLALLDVIQNFLGA